jgi:hypothetical protein
MWGLVRHRSVSKEEVDIGVENKKIGAASAVEMMQLRVSGYRIYA